jgi:hypothetical protein
MNMKKIKVWIIAGTLFLGTIPAPAFAATEGTPSTTTTEKTNDAAKAKVLVSRLYAIHAMDKSSLSATEKSALRNEVQDIKKNLQSIGGGVYISAGAIIVILIILLLIL